jgi:riboflavin synthase
MVDGVCLTASEVKHGRIFMDIGIETLKSTALKRLRSGSRVNLERAMTLSDRIGGHIVYGHVAAVGRVVSVKLKSNTRIITIRAQKSFLNKLVPKGSVSVNGVSMTVNEICKDFFRIGVIPETAKRTNLGRLGSSDTVNLEPDMLSAK